MNGTGVYLGRPVKLEVLAVPFHRPHAQSHGLPAARDDIALPSFSHGEVLVLHEVRSDEFSGSVATRFAVSVDDDGRGAGIAIGVGLKLFAQLLHSLWEFV